MGNGVGENALLFAPCSLSDTLYSRIQSLPFRSPFMSHIVIERTNIYTYVLLFFLCFCFFSIFTIDPWLESLNPRGTSFFFSFTGI